MRMLNKVVREIKDFASYSLFTKWRRKPYLQVGTKNSILARSTAALLVALFPAELFQPD